MLKRLIKIFAPPVFPDDEDKTRRARYANAITLIFLGTVIAAQVVMRLFLGYSGFEVMDWVFIGVAGWCIAGLIRLRHGHVQSTAIMLIGLVWVASNGLAAQQQFGVKDASYLVNFAIVLMTGLLLSWRAAWVVTGLSILSGFALAYAEQSGRIRIVHFPIMDFAVMIAVVFIFNGGLISFLIRGLEDALKRSRKSIEELASANSILNYTQGELQNRSKELIAANTQLENRTQKLHGIAEVARTTTAIHSFDQLLPVITIAISKQLGYYHVGLFLVDEQSQYAILRSASTAEGWSMIDRGYRIPVGHISPIGFVTQSGQPRIIAHTEADPTFPNQADLPETRSQIVLPLGSGDEITGALDLQSREPNAFSEDDIATLSILADQVTIAIDNALLYEQSQAALREADIASRQAASQAWFEYGKTIRVKGYRYDGIKSEPLKDTKQPVRESEGLAIPVQLRDQTIGCLKLRTTDPTRQWTEDELSMVRATADRVALALESARLLEEAQKRARRESFLADVTARLGASFQLDSILRDTVQELGQTLKNSTITFQLVNPSAPPVSEPQKSNDASATSES